MKIIFLGPPGVGKGTQAKQIADDYKIANISTGDIMRDAVQKGTPLGLEAKSYMDSGGLVPDQIVMDIVKEKLKSEECRNGFLLDGFPRTEVQADSLSDITIDRVVSFELGEEEIIRRLTKRRKCSSCNSLFNIEFHPPQKDGICDNCGGALTQRDDDKEETIKRRLIVYKEETEPLIEYYAKKGLLAKVDSNGEIEDVYSRLKEVLEDSQDRR
ncbi:MAG: adenylate kinase [Nitrospirota bacterium]